MTPKVKDVFPIDNGIITSIAAISPLSFPDDMDLLLLSKCGNRQITPIVSMLLDSSGTLSQAAINRLAALINSEYGESWERVKTALELEYNPLINSVYHEEESTETEGENTDTSAETSENDVSSFSPNPTQYISDGKSSREGTGSGTSKSSVTRKLDRTANGTNYKSSELVMSEIQLRINSRFTAQVVNDVKNYIAMQIY